MTVADDSTGRVGGLVVVRRTGGIGTFSALRARTGLRRVLAAYALFALVEFYSWLVVVLWAYAEGGAPLAGLASIVQLVPAALIAPAISSVGDRLPRGRALVLVHGFVALSAAATFLSLAVDAAVPVVLFCGTVLTTALATIRPVHYASLPQLAPGPTELVSANSLSSMIDGSLRFFGPVAAGLAVAAWGPAAAMGLVAVAVVAAPFLCLGLGLAAAQRTGPQESSIAAALGGLRALRGDWAALALLVVMAFDFLLAGALDVMGVSFADRVLGAAEAGAGVLIGSIGVGGLLGAITGSVLARRARLAPIVMGGGVLQGLAFASVALVDSLPVAFALLALAGFGGALMLVSGRTLLQRSTDDAVLARVFAVQESTALIGVALGAGLSPLLLDTFGPQAAWAPLGLAVATLAALALLLTRRLDERARLHPFEVALLRNVPFLASLAPYELERLAATATWREVPAGQPVVRAGESGTEFYVVESGELVVEVPGQDPRPVIGAHGFFGEIALLRRIPRTATVTASTPVRLLVIGDQPFLAAVTGADGAQVSAELTARYADLDSVGGQGSG